MDDLLLRVPATVYFGNDVLQRIPALVAPYGNRALLLTESALREARFASQVRDLLERRGTSCLVYDEVSPGFGAEAADEVLQLARASQIQIVLGMGGMKVLTAARITAAALKSGFGFRDILADPAALATAAPVPYIEIPSSCRNHYMFRDQTPVVDEVSHLPLFVRLPVGTTKAVLADPRMSLTLSPRYTGAVMMDVLLASIEGYLSHRSTVLSDAVLIRAIELLASNVEDACRVTGNERARTHGVEAGLLSAIGLAHTSQGVGGAITYTINARFRAPRSWVATVLLPHVIDYVAGARPEKLHQLARALGAGHSGEDDILQYIGMASEAVGARKGAGFGLERRNEQLAPAELASAVSNAVRRLIGVLDLPSRLRDLDLPLDEMADVAETAAGLELAAGSPVPFSSQEIYDLIKQAF